MAVVRAELAERSSMGLRLRDRYRIVSPLGRGTLGEVSVAEDEVTGERVAVRLLPRELSPKAVQRSRRSIIAASAAHPSCFVRVLDSGETSDGRSFMVMELAEGRGLHEILAENEPLEVSEALRLALDLGGAVETLHNLGTVHAAIRPRNVRILPEGRVKLMDLEVAGLRGAPELHELQGDGAPADYVAPEQIRGDPVSVKTDVYAFGLDALRAPLRGATVPDRFAPSHALGAARRVAPAPAPPAARNSQGRAGARQPGTRQAAGAAAVHVQSAERLPTTRPRVR